MMIITKVGFKQLSNKDNFVLLCMVNFLSLNFPGGMTYILV